MTEGTALETITGDERNVLRSYRKVREQVPDFEVVYVAVPVPPEVLAGRDREAIIATVSKAAMLALEAELDPARDTGRAGDQGQPLRQPEAGTPTPATTPVSRPAPCRRGTNEAQAIAGHWCLTHDAEWLLSDLTCAALTASDPVGLDVDRLTEALHHLHMPMSWRWWDPTTGDTSGTSVEFARRIAAAYLAANEGDGPDGR